ncbi:MAG: T9SS type A sorting domain-containing protein [Candidatus Kapaibacteriales bacterium]
MFNKFLKLFAAIYLVFLVNYHFVYSQGSILIFNEYDASDTIDMGMCVIGDSLETLFNIFNLTDKPIKIGGNDYTFSIEKLTADPNDLTPLEFFGPRDLPKIIDSSSFSTFKVKYIPYPISPQFPVGKKIVRLRLGVFDPNFKQFPDSLGDLIRMREFILIARKSSSYLDTYEQLINFDSVWVNPKDTLKRWLILQNNSSLPIGIDSIIFLRSINAEIWLERKTFPIILQKYRSGDERQRWLVQYFPKNLGKDTALIVFRYKHSFIPDSNLLVQTIVRGVGVLQKIDLIKVEGAQVIDNTIDFGPIPIDTTREVKFFIQNNGNLPFGILTQDILDFYTNQKINSFYFSDSLRQTRHLYPTELDSFKIVFRPNGTDTFLAKVVFHSDLPTRKINGFPDSVRRVEFYLRGVGLAPKIAVESKNIDFGNIIINNFEGCPSFRDTIIKIYNNGNYVLRVDSIRLEPPYPQTPFRIYENRFDIPPYSSKTLLIRFDSIATNVGTYSAKLILVSNFSKISDTVSIQLVANGILPDPINISIPPQTIVKPGRNISLPILVPPFKVNRAREYVDTLKYNPTVLRYAGFSIQNTASFNAEEIFIEEDRNNGKLAILLRTRWNQTFLPVDTLIKINFQTFLGDEILSRIDFLATRFGDGICSRVLLPNPSGGEISLDSLCGISSKLFNGKNGIFRFDDISPNPANNQIYLNFQIAFPIHTSLSIFNYAGVEVKKIFDGVLEPNVYQFEVPFSGLTTGVYFVKMQAGIFNEVKYFVITE